jgi:hypothetical protein
MTRAEERIKTLEVEIQSKQLQIDRLTEDNLRRRAEYNTLLKRLYLSEQLIEKLRIENKHLLADLKREEIGD